MKQIYPSYRRLKALAVNGMVVTMSRFRNSCMLLIVLLFIWIPVQGQISINAFNIPFSENFNSLAITGNSNTLPSGWYLNESGINANANYTADYGILSNGDTYSYGITSSTERAFGGLQSGTLIPTIGASFTNNTGGVITSLTIEYTGEQWRLGALTRHDRLDFQYSTTASIWTDFNALDFTAPVTTGTLGNLDGNLTGNFTTLNQTITGLSIATGATIWIKWLDVNATGADDGLAIDDFSITASDPCLVNISSFIPTSGPAGTIVIITGNNFTGASQVFFNNIPATSFTVVNSTTIIATVPAGATTGLISVLNICLGANATNFTVIEKNCPDARNLIISELCDPQNNYQTDRFIEIYNPTDLVIDLASWEVRAIANNSISASCGINSVLCWPLSGTINPGQALTCGYTTPVAGGSHTFTNPSWITTDPNPACFNWNGERRDGAALYNKSVRIDGIIRDNTGTDWYSNSSLVRNPNICSPNPNSSFTEWTKTNVTSADLATPLLHSSTCAGTSPVIITQPANQTICENGSATLTLTASAGLLPYNFQWKFFNTFSGNWENVIGVNYSVVNTAAASTLTISNIPLSFNGLQYYCEVSNNDNACYQASKAVQLKVNPIPTISIDPVTSACSGETSAILNYSATTGSPDQYSIVWSPAAITAMFVNVDAILPFKPCNDCGTTLSSYFNLFGYVNSN